jgi:hypothetical protein
MNRAEFEAGLKKLVASHAGRTENVRCVECVGSTGCVESTFCRNGKGLVRCHYCVDSERCHDSTHCRSSRDLLRCNHCVECERCVGSAHLVKSIDCQACTYCFGCVGLTGKDFHVLNEPYERRDYFALVAKLSAALGLR